MGNRYSPAPQPLPRQQQRPRLRRIQHPVQSRSTDPQHLGRLQLVTVAGHQHRPNMLLHNHVQPHQPRLGRLTAAHRRASFQGSIQVRDDRVYPSITGNAYVTAETTLILDPSDPFVTGICP